MDKLVDDSLVQAVAPRDYARRLAMDKSERKPGSVWDRDYFPAPAKVADPKRGLGHFRNAVPDILPMLSRATWYSPDTMYTLWEWMSSHQLPTRAMQDLAYARDISRLHTKARNDNPWGITQPPRAEQVVFPVYRGLGTALPAANTLALELSTIRTFHPNDVDKELGVDGLFYKWSKRMFKWILMENEFSWMARNPAEALEPELKAKIAAMAARKKEVSRGAKDWQDFQAMFDQWIILETDYWRRTSAERMELRSARGLLTDKFKGATEALKDANVERSTGGEKFVLAYNSWDKLQTEYSILEADAERLESERRKKIATSAAEMKAFETKERLTPEWLAFKKAYEAWLPKYGKDGSFINRLAVMRWEAEKRYVYLQRKLEGYEALVEHFSTLVDKKNDGIMGHRMLLNGVVLKMPMEPHEVYQYEKLEEDASYTKLLKASFRKPLQMWNKEARKRVVGELNDLIFLGEKLSRGEREQLIEYAKGEISRMKENAAKNQKHQKKPIPHGQTLSKTDKDNIEVYELVKKDMENPTSEFDVPLVRNSSIVKDRETTRMNTILQFSLLPDDTDTVEQSKDMIVNYVMRLQGLVLGKGDAMAWKKPEGSVEGPHPLDDTLNDIALKLERIQRVTATFEKQKAIATFLKELEDPKALAGIEEPRVVEMPEAPRVQLTWDQRYPTDGRRGHIRTPYSGKFVDTSVPRNEQETQFGPCEEDVNIERAKMREKTLLSLLAFVSEIECRMMSESASHSVRRPPPLEGEWSRADTMDYPAAHGLISILRMDEQDSELWKDLRAWWRNYDSLCLQYIDAGKARMEAKREEEKPCIPDIQMGALRSALLERFLAYKKEDEELAKEAEYRSPRKTAEREYNAMLVKYVSLVRGSPSPSPDLEAEVENRDEMWVEGLEGLKWDAKRYLCALESRLWAMEPKGNEFVRWISDARYAFYALMQQVKVEAPAMASRAGAAGPQDEPTQPEEQEMDEEPELVEIMEAEVAQEEEEERRPLTPTPVYHEEEEEEAPVLAPTPVLQDEEEPAPVIEEEEERPLTPVIQEEERTPTPVVQEEEEEEEPAPKAKPKKKRVVTGTAGKTKKPKKSKKTEEDE